MGDRERMRELMILVDDEAAALGEEVEAEALAEA